MTVGAMRYRPGLRAKLNAAILLAVLASMALFVWLDYRHEVNAVMSAYAASGPGTAGVQTRPLPSALTPGAVGRRALVIHSVHAVTTVVVLVAAINVALSAFVLTPIARIRLRMEQMSRGHWRGPGERGRPSAC